MDASRLQSDTPNALLPGTRLGEFELKGLLGVGGFGIVYLAFDHALEREVAVKEYMPASLAGRTETLHISLRSQSDAETFAVGLRSFVNEAKMLARFDHPALLKVHRFWEANGTAYMAMPVLRGRTVKEIRLAMSEPPDEAWLRALLDPLLGAIERLHSEGVYHRDIAPDNIQIEPDGHPVLLDFGAARRVISDKSQALTAILKPAYAPIEQYAEVSSVKQGPWTDLYALGATLHFLLLGRPPPPATARAVHDDPSMLDVEMLPGCSDNFLRTIDWMLAPRPSDRPQSVAALREVLDGRALPPRRRIDAAPPPSQWDRTVVLPPPSSRTVVDVPLDGDDPPTQVVPPSVAQGTRVTPAPRPDPVSEPVAAAVPDPEPAFAAPPVAAAWSPAPALAPRSKVLPLGLGAVAVAVAAFMLWPKPAPVPLAPATPASATAPAVAAPASPSVPESRITKVEVPARPAAAQLTEAPRSVPVVKPAPTQAPVPAPAPAPATLSRPLPAPAVASTPAQAVAVPVLPPPEPAKPRAEASAPASLPASAALPAPEPTKPAKPVATGPEATCGPLNPLSYFVCMERECLRSQNSNHPDCLKWHRAARRENQ
jgi:serine/threonine protein kinase